MIGIIREVEVFKHVYFCFVNVINGSNSNIVCALNKKKEDDLEKFRNGPTIVLLVCEKAHTCAATNSTAYVIRCYLVRSTTMIILPRLSRVVKLSTSRKQEGIVQSTI